MKLQITSVQIATTPSENRRLSPHVHSDCVEKKDSSRLVPIFYFKETPEAESKWEEKIKIKHQSSLFLYNIH